MLEKASWNNKTASCAAGKTCTHYTQIVWKKTASIGCGINRNALGKWKVLLVCNYNPAGNGPGPPF
jgi:pathogenesis-related protein 1